MTQCKVELLHNSPLWIGANGARTCWDSGDKSDTVMRPVRDVDVFLYPPSMIEMETICGPNDAALIDRVGNKFKHASILEHLVYTFYITDFSRGCLQELSRHRMASPSVKSTRYTLKELKKEEPFYNNGEALAHLDGTDLEGCTMDDERAQKYLVFSGDSDVDFMSIKALENLRQIIVKGVSNDKAKYCMPEAYKVNEQLTINARSLQNLLFLRTDKAALWEIQEVAHAMFDALPEDHKYLFEDKLKH